MEESNRRTFEQKYKRGQFLVDCISSFTDYNPPRNLESVEEMMKLLHNISMINSEEQMISHERDTVRKEKQAKFKTNTDSVIKLLPALKGIIMAQYGKDADGVKQIARLIRKMRTHHVVSKRLSKKNGEKTLVKKKANKSYDTIYSHLYQIVNIVKAHKDYNAPNERLSPANLEAIKAEVFEVKSQENSLSFKLSKIRDSRIELYNELNDRAQRIKIYTRSVYGSDSREYNLIRSLRF